MPSKNWTYCPAFPNSIALRREIAKASRSKLPLCVHALTAGAEGVGEGKQSGNQEDRERQGKGGRQRKQNRHGEKSGGGDGVAQRIKCEQQVVWRAEGVERLSN